MTISEYACDDCGYTNQGCGGLGILMSGAARQTISCAACRALHDVDTGVNVREEMDRQRTRKRRGPGRRAPIATPTLRDEVAKLKDFACPVDPLHPVRPWTDEEQETAVPDAVVAVCPRCEGHVTLVRTVLLAD